MLTDAEHRQTIFGDCRDERCERIIDSRSRGKQFRRGSRLDESDVREIRHRADLGESYPEIAEDFPVWSDHVGRIVRGEVWRHVDQ